MLISSLNPRLLNKYTGCVEINFFIVFTQSTVISCIYRSEETGSPGHADKEQPVDLEDEEQSIGESLEDETDGTDDRDTKYLFKKKERMSRSVESLKVNQGHWGLTEYKKSNHPLSIMVGSTHYKMLEQRVFDEHPLYS